MDFNDIKKYYDSIDIFGDEVMPVEFQEKYTDFAMEAYRLAMEKNAYKKPSIDEVKRNSKVFFQVDILTESNQFLYKNGLCRYVFEKEDGFERSLQKRKMKFVGNAIVGDFWNSYVYDSIGRFLVFQPSLFGFVSLSENDNSVDIKLNHSKVLTSLHFSKFIFQQSRSSFVWLVNNTPHFLIRLCKKYDFDKNIEINKLVVEDSIGLLNDFSNSNREKIAYDSLFVRRDSDGKLHIHDSLIRDLCYYMGKSDVSKNTLFICYYSDVLSSIRGRSPYYLEDFSLPERMQIAAYVGYYYHRSGAMTTHNVFRKELFENDDFVRFIESHDYFGLDGFQDLIESLVEEEEEARNLSLLRSSEN
ncbi:MAG: hypothetical protein MJZ33_03760 [Paludibacteraceae bacterium]|nr:hypothetical protein [Paludibacteraceae bacterium]